MAIVTIVLGAAVPEQRAHQGWSEGLAVLGTALIVIFLGQWRACAVVILISQGQQVMPRRSIASACTRAHTYTLVLRASFSCAFSTQKRTHGCVSSRAGAGQDFSKERQFQKLNALKDVIDVKVTRGGKQVLVPNTEVSRGGDGWGGGRGEGAHERARAGQGV